MSRTQDAATIRSNVGTLVGWATSNTAMRADLAKNAVTLIEAGLSGLLARTPAASDGSLDVAVGDLVAAARPGGTVMLARYEGRPDDLAWEAVTEPDGDGLCVGSGPTAEKAIAAALAKTAHPTFTVSPPAQTDFRVLDGRSDGTARRALSAARLSESASEGKTE